MMLQRLLLQVGCSRNSPPLETLLLLQQVLAAWHWLRHYRVWKQGSQPHQPARVTLHALQTWVG
jgi:hypothetical protein